MRNVNRSRY